MSKERDEILRKVQACMALAAEGSGATEGEMLAALAQVQRLLARYNLSMGDVEYYTNGNGKKRGRWEFSEAHVELLKPGKQSLSTAEATLSAAVMELTGTRALRTRTAYQAKGSEKVHICITFVGDVVDVHLATTLFSKLDKTMHDCAFRDYGKSWSKAHRSYCDGFAKAVLLRAREQARTINSDFTPAESDKYAIVLRDKATWLEDAIEEAIPERGKASKRRASPQDPHAYRAGIRDGAAQELDIRHAIDAQPAEAAAE
ncbi:MAG: DUF2786 domain-containing protein [Armatimonadota bacterium]